MIHAFIEYIYSHRFETQKERLADIETISKEFGGLRNDEGAAAGSKMSFNSTDIDNSRSNRKNQHVYTVFELCELYVLGDFLMSPGFKVAAFDAIWGRLVVNYKMDWGIVGYVHRSTAALDRLRQLLVDFAAKSGHTKKPDSFRKHGLNMPPEFLVDVLVVASSILHAKAEHKPRSRKEWLEVDKCVYHDHEQEEEDEGDDSVVGQ